MVALQDYQGREQAYVKHVLLEQYLQVLIHKTASAYGHIAYVDGFAGPWQSGSETFQDTSFGIALKVLTAAKASWKQHGRDVKMYAFLVERNPDAFTRLATICSHFPEVEVKAIEGAFLDVLPSILKEIPREAFTFFLIDPKGWKLPLDKLTPMPVRASSEVIFNFMFEFINRAASMEKDATIVAGLKALMPYGDWQARLAALGRDASPDDRKAVLVDAFSESLRRLGKFTYVCETTILRPDKERALYCLFYATRHEIGLEVFRNCQVTTLAAQSESRAQTKVKRVEQQSGQAEMFYSMKEMGPDTSTHLFLEAERHDAEKTLVDLVPQAPGSVLYRDLWPRVLERHVVKKSDVNVIAARLRKDGSLFFPGWEQGKRVPQSKYLVQRT